MSDLTLFFGGEADSGTVVTESWEDGDWSLLSPVTVGPTVRIVQDGKPGASEGIFFPRPYGGFMISYPSLNTGKSRPFTGFSSFSL